jgi:RNA polymerase sigma factor (sigma-70 family)
MSPRPTTASAIVLRDTAARIAEDSYDWLRGAAYNAGARGEQIEEAVDEGFARLMSAFPGDPGDLPGVRRYLVRCVQSAAWNMLRTERRRERWLASEVERDRFDKRAADTTRSDGVDRGEPIERVLDAEILEDARELLGQLPEEWVAVLLLTAAGYGTAEVAQELGLSTRQVRKRIQKANARLRELGQ